MKKYKVDNPQAIRVINAAAGYMVKAMKEAEIKLGAKQKQIIVEFVGGDGEKWALSIERVTKTDETLVGSNSEGS